MSVDYDKVTVVFDDLSGAFRKLLDSMIQTAKAFDALAKPIRKEGRALLARSRQRRHR